jgi:hypothetical protein
MIDKYNLDPSLMTLGKRRSKAILINSTGKALLIKAVSEKVLEGRKAGNLCLYSISKGMYGESHGW